MTGARLAAAWADALVRGLVACGVREAVVSPGSRSTPVVLALDRAAGRGDLRLHAVLDERSAAFVALGLSRVGGAPVALACTSGSAGAHWLPAVVEASRSRLPLLLLTADRPPELQGVGAPQTIDQAALFGRHVRASLDPGAPDAAAGLRWLGALAARAVDAARGERPGPVHVNLPFREPLWDPESDAPPAPEGPAAPRVLRGPPAPPADGLAALVAALEGARRGVIVAGPGDPGVAGRPRAAYHRALGAALRRLAARLGWPLLAEAASPARFAAPDGDEAVVHGDLVLRAPGFAAAAAPDLVLRFGQVPTSKPVARWLARAGLGRTWLLDPGGELQDPDHTAAALLVADPLAAAEALVAAAPARPAGAWAAAWARADRLAEAAVAPLCAGDPPWGGSVARALVAALPPGALLHVASSLPIRDLDAFSGPGGRPLTVVANRGANGIDGTISTALGEALAWRGGPVAVLAGDLAFLHDAGALVTAARPGAHAAAPLTVVVADNGGGGIFDHLPVAAQGAAFEPLFAAPQGVDPARVALGAGLPCDTARDAASLGAALAEHLERPGPSVVHVPFDRAHDLARHREAWAAAADAVDGDPTLAPALAG